MKNALATSLIVAAIAMAAPAIAQTAAAPTSTPDYGSWKVTLGGATDNRSKDASKSAGDAYIYGNATWTSPSGFFYAAPGFETIDSSTGSEMEVQAYAGIKPKFGDLAIDLRAAYKYQTDANPNTDEDAWEFTGNFTYPVGPAKARLQIQHSPDGTGGTRAWTWVEGRVAWDVSRKLNASVAVGQREQDNSLDYVGWNAGVTYAAASNVSLDLRWYGTDGPSTNQTYDDELVAGFVVTF